jgi:hypothetical protein
LKKEEIMEDLTNNEKYERAKKRMEEVKGFYSHLVVYLIVNLVLILSQLGIFSGGFVKIDFPGWAMFTTPFFWGIGLFFHGLYVFGRRLRFLKDWEDRKIKEFMDKDDEGFKNASRWE